MRSEYLNPAVKRRRSPSFPKERTDDRPDSSRLFGATTIRPPFDPELAPVEEAMRAAFPPLSDETLPEIRRQVTEGLPGVEPEDLTAGGRVRPSSVSTPSDS